MLYPILTKKQKKQKDKTNKEQMSYYYSNPGGFSISKTVLPSVTSSICQSAGLNSGGIVRESATVSTTSTAVGPYVQQLGGGGGSSSAGGSVTAIQIINPGLLYSRAPRIIITGGSGSGASAICTIDVNGGINNVTITNNGSGYTSAPDVIVPPPGEGEGYDTAILQAVISSGSSSSSPSASFQQVADNDPKLILLK